MKYKTNTTAVSKVNYFILLQTHFVAKLLIEKYGLPKKYVEGADKALNKKKWFLKIVENHYSW